VEHQVKRHENDRRPANGIESRWQWRTR
jgi:hypothetical protein